MLMVHKSIPKKMCPLSAVTPVVTEPSTAGRGTALFAERRWKETQQRLCKPVCSLCQVFFYHTLVKGTPLPSFYLH